MGDRQRSFHDSWFKNHNWLEYSVTKDAAFCFYCYLFKQQRHENFGIDAFTSKGFCNWKNATKSFVEHVGKVDSLHNKARKHVRILEIKGKVLDTQWQVVLRSMKKNI